MPNAALPDAPPASRKRRGPERALLRSPGLAALAVCAALAPLDLAAAAAAGSPELLEGHAASLDSTAQHAQLPTDAPEGFESLDQGLTTAFDVYFEGRLVGSFRATLADHKLVFADPGLVTRALGGEVRPQETQTLLGQPLDAHESLRCLPGQASACGFLPAPQSGVIVDPDRFRVTLVLSLSYMSLKPSAPRVLGDPISGPSLIQEVQVALASGNGAGDTFGANLDTYASLGRDSIYLQNQLNSQSGGELSQAYAQHIGQGWRAAGGVLEATSSPIIQNYRYLGLEVGSFTGTLLDADRSIATQVQVLVPRQATVELYRAGVLVSARQYDAGVQTLDTRQLPSGSYPIRIVVRDGGSVLSDETRIFTKSADIPPPGKTYYALRVGDPITDQALATGSTSRRPYVPVLGDSYLVEATASRRVFGSSGVTAGLLAAKSGVYPELTFQTYRGLTRILASSTVGANGTYGALLSAEAIYKAVTASVSFRTVKSDDKSTNSIDYSVFRPFYRTEDDVSAGVGFPLVGGSVSARATYQKPRFGPSEYNYQLQYNRNIARTPFGDVRLYLTGSYSSTETRVGFSFNFFRRLDNHTFATGAVGVDALPRAVGTSTGAAPVVDAAVTRSGTFRSADYTATLGVQNDETENRAFAGLSATSSLGAVDGQLGYAQVSGGRGGMNVSLNAQTGFFLGAGAAHLGLTRSGNAIVLAQIEDPDHVRSPGKDAEIGGYRLTVDDQPYGRVVVGSDLALGLTALRDYRVTVTPQGAPPYDIDLTPIHVPLYPGNVVRLRFTAKRSAAFFGRVVDGAGAPVPNAEASAGGDMALTDSSGYFTVTATASDTLTVRRPDGATCASLRLKPLIAGLGAKALVRLGAVTCAASPGAPSSATGTSAPNGAKR